MLPLPFSLRHMYSGFSNDNGDLLLGWVLAWMEGVGVWQQLRFTASIMGNVVAWGKLMNNTMESGFISAKQLSRLANVS